MKKTFQRIKIKKPFAYSMIFLSAFLFAISIQVFVMVAHTFTSGISALALIPSILVDGLTPYVSAIYLAMNIPLMLLFWKKVKKDFLYKTLFFLVIQALFGLIFMFDSISEPLRSLVIIPDDVLLEVWPIFIMSMLGGGAVGVSITIAWKYGGSTGGGDIITYYYSTKKKVSIGFISFLISMIFVVISFIVSISTQEDTRDKALPILVSTIMYVAISSIIVNILYPKYATVSVEVHSRKSKEINRFLKESKYIHSWQNREVQSGYVGDKKIIITTVMLLLEYKEFRKNMISIDSKVWIQAIRIKSLYGRFITTSFD